MAEPNSRRAERLTATAVLAVAVSIATWVVYDPAPTVVSPKPVEQAQPPQPEKSENDAPATKLPMNVELVDLSTITFPEPAPPAPPATPSQVMAAAPPPARVQPAAPLAPAPASDTAPLRPMEPEARLEPEPRMEPKARTAPPAITPLRPTIKKDEASVPPPQRVKPLEPGVLTAKATPKFVPRKFEPEPPRTAPSKPTPPPKNTKALLAAAARIEKTDAARPPPSPLPTVVTSEALSEGRALLRILEQGSGPSIEIGWPDNGRERNQLYRALKACLGMRTGLLNDDGSLYLAEGVRSQPTVLNTDKFSGFVRRPAGAIAGDEQAEIAHVRTYHPVAARAAPARIFPRRVDAFLIGGLRQAVGEGYLSLKSIRASYRLEGGRVMVGEIMADGRSVTGAIDLSAASTGCSG